MSKKLLRKKLALMLANLKKKRRYYTEIEYLESTGTQYIDTGLLSTENSKVDCVFGFSSMESGAANNCAIFGGRNNTTTNTFTFFKLASGNPQYFRFDYNNQKSIGTASNLTWNTTSKYRFEYNGSRGTTTNITTGESAYENIAPASTFTTSPITLFAVNTSNQAGQFMPGRIYRYWYTDGTNTIDLIPVLDWDMTPCMYDRVSGQLFYNQGSGDFIAGREIHYVDYLENESSQASVNYIPTKYTPTTNTNLEAKVRYTGGASGATWAIGAATWWGIHYQGSGPKIGITNSSTDQYQVYAPYTAGNDITLKLDGSNVYADGTLIGSLTKQNASSTLTIFRYATSANLSWVGRIYYLDMWDNNGDVFKFRPAIDENGVGYLFDRVTHTIYDNAGTGAFAYPAREVEYLESDGARAIVADVTVDDTCGYDVKWMALNSNDTIILGTKGSGDSRWVLSGSNNPYVNISWNTSSGGTGLGLNKIQTAQMNYFNDRKRILNDTPFTDITQTLSANASTYSIGIFGGYWGASQISLYSTCRIYYAKISKGTGLVRDFVPMFKDGSPCLFDKIGGLYYFGTGTGSFTTGKIVEPEYE